MRDSWTRVPRVELQTIAATSAGGSSTPACGLEHGIYAVRVGLGERRVDEVVRRMDEDFEVARAALARAGDAFPKLERVD
jgi:hypothetical protein